MIILKTNLKISDIPKDKIYKGKNGEYVSTTIVVNNELNQYDKQGPVFISQSKEEREEKLSKHYLGDVEVVFTDGNLIDTTKSLKEDE